ncbi:MAG: AAA family ATPase [Pseudomonadota bacterium]
MKIKSLEINDFSPIKHLKIDDMGDVVIIAGANGSGKTRLKEAIVNTLQGETQMSLSIEATREKEKEHFGDSVINIVQGSINPKIVTYMKKRSFGRGQYVGSLVQIDSDRNIQTIKYQQVSWQVTDPDDQETKNNFYCQNFTNRWQDFMDYIHRKVAAYQNQLATEVTKGSNITATAIKEKLPHPLDKYKAIFNTLLPEKKLLDINPVTPKEFQYEDSTGKILPFRSLSSGEQEVIKVLFDVARKDIKDSIIIVDEPELHLHPTLSFKLIESLKAIGDYTNQFIFLTHSADLISTYYSTGNVYFIDFERNGLNQAYKLSDLNHSHKKLVDLIGENLGLFAVGKKIVFVEGKESSIDRLVYHSIAQKYFPEAKIIPIASVENVIALNAFEEQIRNAIFGIDFFMIRDRDGLSPVQVQSLEANGRIKCLKRRHIENYFLDSEILLKVANKLYITTVQQTITRECLEQKLKEIATGQLKLNLLQNAKEYIAANHNFNIPTVKTLDVKDIDNIINEFSKSTETVLTQLATDLSDRNLKAWMKEEVKRLEDALHNDTWKNDFRGKPIFSKCCSDVLKEDILKVRQAYIDIALGEKPEVFDDVKMIYECFI